MKPILSIVYVYFNTPNELKNSIISLNRALDNIPSEVIVVDNGSYKNFQNDLDKLSNVTVIKNNKNYGYGKGLNQGVMAANGKYLLLANPDIEFEPNSIKYLLNKIEKKSEIGVIGPQMIDKKGKILQSISGMPYLPKALIIFSFIGKIWRHNPILKEYHNLNLDRNNEQYVDVIGGACMMMRKSLFNDIGGFDERFFMYFEEADFCLRIKKKGYRILYYPKAKVTHLVGRSSQDKEWIERTFEQSRFKFFKKYHGLIPGILAELMLRFFKLNNILLLIIIILSAFLNFYKINELMIFIGDQGWFYLSARDMVLNGQIPLVGIPSSHPWLHQGPLWTYMLAGVFWLFGFNPLNGAYLTITLGIISIILIYIVGTKLFSKRVGLISAILYATSPLVIIHSRTPYHTSPIPLFTLLFIFSVYRWIKGNVIFFPLSIFFLAILYNLELATAILWFILFIVLAYGVWKKTEWVKKIFSIKNLIYLLLAFIIPMIPILIYDFRNDFPQTLKFVAWISYRILKFFGFPSIHGEIESVNFDSMIAFSFQFYQNLIFAGNNVIALIILLLSFGMLIFSTYNLLRKKEYNVGFIILILWILISLIGYFANKTSSEAYLPILFPALIYLVAFSFDKIMKKKIFFIPAVLLVVFLSFMNSYFVILSEYSAKGLNFSKRLSIAKEIVKRADGRDYNLVGVGGGSQFESFTMNYEYLTWWFGHSSSKSPQKLKFIIRENKNGVFLVKNE